MPKPKSSARTIDADTDPDGVDEALGLGKPDEVEDDDELEDDDTDDDGDTDDEGDEDDDDEDPLEELRAAVRELKRDNAKLKREAAAARVAGKAKASGGTTAKTTSGDGETVEQALERGREEARAELGLERAGDRIRAGLVGIIPNDELDDFVDDLRLERYVDEDGKPDSELIKALVDRQRRVTRRRKVPARAGTGKTGRTTGKKSKGELMGDVLSDLRL